jgi:hypothetical protein
MWNKEIKPLSPLQLLEVYSDIIPSLPTILAECEEQKRALERKVINELKSARARNNAREHFATVLTLSVGLGVEITKLEKNIRFLNNLIFLSKPKSSRMRQSYADMEKRRLIALETPIETLLSGKVRKTGKNKTCLCPLHSERTPSFTIFPNNRWYCFGCNEGGDAISLVMRMHNLKFIDAIGFLTSNNQNIYAK